MHPTEKGMFLSHDFGLFTLAACEFISLNFPPRVVILWNSFLRASTYIHNPFYVNRFMHLTGKTHNFPFYFSVFTLTACEGLVRNSFLILNFPPDVCIMELIFRIMGFSIFFLMYFVYLPYYYLQGLHAFTLVCMLVNFVCMLF